MNDTELVANFKPACQKWAMDNGPRPLANDTLFDAKMVNGVITIGQWFHDSDTPTLDQLKKYTVQQVIDAEIDLERDRILDPSKEPDAYRKFTVDIALAGLTITDSLQTLPVVRSDDERRAGIAALYRASEHS